MLIQCRNIFYRLCCRRLPSNGPSRHRWRNTVTGNIRTSHCTIGSVVLMRNFATAATQCFEIAPNLRNRDLNVCHNLKIRTDTAKSAAPSIVLPPLKRSPDFDLECQPEFRRINSLQSGCWRCTNFQEVQC